MVREGPGQVEQDGARLHTRRQLRGETVGGWNNRTGKERAGRGRGSGYQTSIMDDSCGRGTSHVVAYGAWVSAATGSLMPIALERLPLQG